MTEADWYADGLRFECSRCGNCCTGEPGLVRMTDDEVRTMARHVEMDEAKGRALIDEAAAEGVVAAQRLQAADYDLDEVTPDADNWKYAPPMM